MTKRPERAALQSVAAIAGALAVLGGVYLWQVVAFQTELDDAFIIFVYAKRLAQGYGLVFNIGERVEGYTCFLWVVLLGAVHYLGASPDRAAPLLSAGFGLATLPLVYAAARAAGAERWTALAAPALLALMPAYAYWGSSGLETLPLTFLVALVVYFYLRQPASRMVPALLALALMTRPDAVLLAAPVVIERLIHWRGRRPFWRWVSILLLVFGPYYACRYAYYGYALPNTFYVKVGYSWEQWVRGQRYLSGFLISGGGLTLVFLAARAVAPRGPVLALFATGTLYGLYTVAVGGDFLGLHRLCIPSLPVWVVLAALGLGRWLAPRPGTMRRLGPVLAVAAATLFIVGVRSEVATARSRSIAEQRLVKALKHRAKALDPLCRPGVQVALIGIGVLGYHTDCRIIDMLGLVDLHIAHRRVPAFGPGLPGHEKYDSDYVLDRKPDYILIPRPSTPTFSRAVPEMHNNPRFEREYYWDPRRTMYCRRRETTGGGRRAAPELTGPSAAARADRGGAARDGRDARARDRARALAPSGAVTAVEPTMSVKRIAASLRCVATLRLRCG